MDESKLELKVGALLLSALLGALALLYLMGELSFGGGARLKTEWAHTGGTVKGAPVRLGGVGIGRVDTIELFPTRRDAHQDPLPVTMTLAISKEAAASLRKDAAVTISSQGPLGEPYLEVYPGTSAEALPEGAPVRGVDSPRIDLVSNKLAGFLEAASKVLDKDPDALAHFVSGISGLTRTVDGVITENRTDVRQIITELSATAKDLRALSASAKTQLEPGGKVNTLINDASDTAKTLRADVPVLSKEAQIALGGVAALAGGFTEEDGKKLKDAIGRYSAAGEKLDGIALRADKMLARLEAGEGTLGATLKDKQVYDDLKSLLADLRKHPWKMLWKD